MLVLGTAGRWTGAQCEEALRDNSRRFSMQLDLEDFLRDQ